MAVLAILEFFVYRDTWMKYEYEVDKDFSRCGSRHPGPGRNNDHIQWPAVRARELSVPQDLRFCQQFFFQGFFDVYKVEVIHRLKYIHTSPLILGLLSNCT
ncbi:hypothetical protein ILYODFUR_038634 [Ilyodon furcidens]|uniref:Anoctamin n=1 Tax=Ilyodon furcidens TaxID=33524 RepID=A0ABV0TQD6_9TELE